MPINISPENVTGIVDLVRFADSATGNLIGLFILMLTFIMCYVAFSDREQGVTLAVSSWLTFIVSVFLSVIGLIDPNLVVVMVVITMGASLLTFQKRRGEY